MYGKGKVIVLEEKTKKDLMVDITKLRPQSHIKIWVKCLRCGEEFKRQFGYLYQLHNCPTYRTINGMREKWCNKCQQFKPTEFFQTNKVRYDGFSSQCITCMQDKGSSKKHLDYLKEKRKTFKGWIQKFLLQKRADCRKHNIKFELDVDFLTDLWNSQLGHCYYTGIKLIFNSTKIRSAQLDRKIPSAGYTKENVVWASKGINSLKSNATLEEFADFINHAVFNFPVRAEFIKLHPDGKVPTKKRMSDVGLDISSIEDIIIKPTETKAIRTGIALVVPNGYYYTIEGRSSLILSGVSPFRGIIDATYSGELIVHMINYNRNIPYVIKSGDRIAQLIIQRMQHIDIIEVEKIDDSYSDRGIAGFGSSGKEAFDVQLQKMGEVLGGVYPESTPQALIKESIISPKSDIHTVNDDSYEKT